MTAAGQKGQDGLQHRIDILKSEAEGDNSGKSTILSILLRFISSNQRSVLAKGVDIATRDRVRLTTSFTLPQQPLLSLETV